MSFDHAVPRRSMLLAAGAGLAAGFLAAGTTEAKAQNFDAVGTKGPAVAELQGKLYALWKDAGDSAGLWYAWFDGTKWSAAARIPKVLTSAAPSLAAFGNILYATWKGRATDKRIWYASFDGSEWSHQDQIPGASSSNGPSVTVFDGKLCVLWKNDDDTGFSGALLDGLAWSSLPNSPVLTSASNPPSLYPFTPAMIASSGLSGVDQGKHNDCVFEASMAAVATTARGQVAISRAIMQHPDGNYEVRFPGTQQRPIAVSQADLKSIHVHDSATWADVLETALILSDPNFANGGHIPPDAKGAPDGSKPTPAQYALYLFTGSHAAKSVASAPKIGEKISEALKNGRPVVAFCANNDNGALVSGHEWTVVACDPVADRITLRNPWGKFGTAGSSKSGINYDGDAEVDMTLQQFGKFYKEVTFGYHEA